MINQGKAKKVPALEHRWKNPNTKAIQDGCPDYLNDLNAMHEAEKVLYDKNSCHRFWKYADVLKCLYPANLGIDTFIHATASQRAEAFLRTIGKWEPTETKVGEEVTSNPNQNDIK